jgi:hypothetical protein
MSSLQIPIDIPWFLFYNPPDFSSGFPENERQVKKVEPSSSGPVPPGHPVVSRSSVDGDEAHRPLFLGTDSTRKSSVS